MVAVCNYLHEMDALKKPVLIGPTVAVRGVSGLVLRCFNDACCMSGKEGLNGVCDPKTPLQDDMILRLRECICCNNLS